MEAGGVLQAYSLLVLRVAAMLRLVPFFAGRPLGWLAWSALSAALGAILVPLYPPSSSEDLIFASAAIGEIAIGGVLGVSIRVAFSCFESAAALVRSALLPMPLYGDGEPQTSRGPDMRLLFSLIAWVCFFSLSGHHAFIKIIVTSLECHPLGWASRGVFELQAAAAQNGLLDLLTMAVTAGLLVAAPVLAASVLAELFSGFLERLFESSKGALPGQGLKILATQLALAATLWLGVKVGLDLLMSTLDALSLCV